MAVTAVGGETEEQQVWQERLRAEHARDPFWLFTATDTSRWGVFESWSPWRNAHAGLGSAERLADRRWWDVRSHVELTGNLQLIVRNS